MLNNSITDSLTWDTLIPHVLRSDNYQVWPWTWTEFTQKDRSNSQPPEGLPSCDNRILRLNNINNYGACVIRQTEIGISIANCDRIQYCCWNSFSFVVFKVNNKGIIRLANKKNLIFHLCTFISWTFLLSSGSYELFMNELNTDFRSFPRRLISWPCSNK